MPAVHIPFQKEAAAPFRGSEDGRKRLRIDRHRLFAEDRLARLERRDRKFRMRDMRRGDIDRVDARIGEHSTGIDHGFRHAVIGGEPACPGRIASGDHQRPPALPGIKRPDEGCRNPAGADDSPIDHESLSSVILFHTIPPFREKSSRENGTKIPARGAPGREFGTFLRLTGA